MATLMDEQMVERAARLQQDVHRLERVNADLRRQLAKRVQKAPAAERPLKVEVSGEGSGFGQPFVGSKGGVNKDFQFDERPPPAPPIVVGPAQIKTAMTPPLEVVYPMLHTDGVSQPVFLATRADIDNRADVCLDDIDRETAKEFFATNPGVSMWLVPTTSQPYGDPRWSYADDPEKLNPDGDPR